MPNCSSLLERVTTVASTNRNRSARVAGGHLRLDPPIEVHEGRLEEGGLDRFEAFAETGVVGRLPNQRGEGLLEKSLGEHGMVHQAIEQADEDGLPREA